MSENEMVKVGENFLPPAKFTDEQFDDAASGSGFLPRLQLLTSNSKKCKSAEFPTNHYALIRDQKHDDLGKNLDVYILRWHPKALETGENIISDYDPNSEEFARIQKKSDVKDSGCMHGPEFLVWIPSIKTFATFFMGTKSARREAGNVKSRVGKAATLSSQLCKNKKYEWFAPECSPCSTPFEMPNKVDALAACEQFDNPPKSEVEGVKEEDKTEGARAR